MQTFRYILLAWPSQISVRFFFVHIHLSKLLQFVFGLFRMAVSGAHKSVERVKSMSTSSPVGHQKAILHSRIARNRPSKTVAIDGYLRYLLRPLKSGHALFCSPEVYLGPLDFTEYPTHVRYALRAEQWSSSSM